ncbi:MAG: 50S ribosomal protein L6 [Oscillospiraceae bacterium]|nr:50S ribosomal protein L6 [Oscillospiraceae bacterium]
MSRIGKQPIAVPGGVTVNIDGSSGIVEIKGPKGTLSQAIHPNMTVISENGNIIVPRPDDAKQNRSLHGLTRSLLSNMVIGVTEGFKKELDISGVGYTAQKQGKTLVLKIGFSHLVNIEEEAGITFEIPAINTPNRAKLIVSGSDKQRVGQVAAEIRKLRPLAKDPYPAGSGITYAGEKIRRKAGKAGKK